MTSAQRCMDVLELLAQQSRPLEAATVARLCGIPRSSTYHLLNDMCERGFVEVDAQHRWSLGPRTGEIRADAPSLGDAIAVLEAFGGDVERTDSAEIVRRTRLHVAQVHRVLAVLSHHRLLVSHDDGTYTLSLRVLGLANQASPVERLRVAARPVLTDLRDACGETANLLVRERSHVVYVEQEESRLALRHAHWIGRRIPLDGSASGRALAAEAAVQVARDAVEMGVTAVACAVPGQSSPAAAISVTGPTARLEGPALERARELVADACARVADRLAIVA